jgi:hypothetical protein
MNTRTILKYPIGLQTLSEIITEGYFYVDKTPWVHSWPRRVNTTFYPDPGALARACL